MWLKFLCRKVVLGGSSPTSLLCILGELAGRRPECQWLRRLALVTGYIDRWQATCEICHVTYETWHMPHATWHMTQAGLHKVIILTIWDSGNFNFSQKLFPRNHVQNAPKGVFLAEKSWIQVTLGPLVSVWFRSTDSIPWILVNTLGVVNTMSPCLYHKLRFILLCKSDCQPIFLKK